MTEAVATRYRVSGMDCGACAAKVETAVRRLPGVEDVSVSATAGTMVVRHGADAHLLPAMTSQLRSLGYGLAPASREEAPSHAEAHGHDHDHDHTHHHDHDSDTDSRNWWTSTKAQLTIGYGLALALAFVTGWIVPSQHQAAFLVAMAIGLVPIARRAFAAARFGSPFSIEMLMTIAAVGAVAIGATEEAAAVVFLFLIGEWLEGVAAGRARASIQALTALVPKTALRDRNGTTEEIPAADLKVGDAIIVRPGDRIPADGEILAGESDVDEAPVTGESTPLRKGPGASVFAGTINTDAVLRIRVTAAAADNTIARVVQLVEEAQESKAPTERFIDRFSRYYTPGVLVVGALVAIVPPLLFGGSWTEWIYKGLAILLIGCPCALVISTPAAIAAALSAGARRGLLLKGGAVLETIGKITAVAFDKTGTLTEGKPKVTDIVAFGRSEAQVLSMAAALESGSNHPLALAILGRAKEDAVPVPPAADARAVPGRGVTGKVGGEAVFLASARAAGEEVALSAAQADQVASLNGEGKTVSVLIAAGSIVGLIAMRDEPRADADEGIAALRAMGVEPVMLTGDNQRTAEAIAKGLHIDARAELLPEDKLRIVRELQAKGKIVAKVGDGINDAPALAAADVGVAMGGGTDVALETADAAILHGRVMDVARMVTLSRRAMANIHQNIAIAIGLKAIFLVTTIVGITGLWPAILADTGATVLVTMNALRLLRVRL
ncbi:heavy metal translocating P-type ATPase [Microvirga antarctica]|uniref:heavy metal translocating P-type ATPase n=1 Tax=Microvirga antarctica TaxID=2819233 RepID=UPI001B3184A4|nr:heavy metal translocating P-type ATPase [Microvirga antarctica]